MFPKLLPQIETITWNYSESGHGKCISDGVGGTTKRKLDSLVAHGQDLDTCDKIVDDLTNAELKTYYVEVPEGSINDLKKESPIPKVKPFEGTMSVHQVSWKRSSPDQLVCRTLSCYQCTPPAVCHFIINKPWKIEIVSDAPATARVPKQKQANKKKNELPSPV